MNQGLFVVAFLLCVSFACGLKCYGCLSTKSWDDCEIVKKEVSCSSSENRCFKAFVDIKDDGGSVTGYRKGCSTEENCKTATDTEACKKGKCEMDCCTGDLCNAATVPLVSAIILGVCAFLATSL